MNTLKQVLSDRQLQLFSPCELEKVQELIDANPIFLNLISGIIDSYANWKVYLLDQEYIKYVKEQKSQLNSNDHSLEKTSTDFYGEYQEYNHECSNKVTL